eukprot:3202105-Amphidinium_carterae.1
MLTLLVVVVVVVSNTVNKDRKPSMHARTAKCGYECCGSLKTMSMSAGQQHPRAVNIEGHAAKAVSVGSDCDRIVGCTVSVVNVERSVGCMAAILLGVQS